MTQLEDRYVNGCLRRRVDQVRIGDHIDLEWDAIADPLGERSEEFSYDFAIVEEIVNETQNCIVLSTTQGTFGFPSEHWLDVDGEQVRETLGPEFTQATHGTLNKRQQGI